MRPFNLADILRPHILNITPYSSARDEYTGKEGVFLDANENPFGPVLSGDNALTTFNRYPDPYQSAIKERLAPIKQVRPTQIFLGNGSDEPIDLLVRATCRPGVDTMLTMPPTYGMYEVSAAINDIALTKVPLTADFQVNTPAVLAAIAEKKPKIVWFCSPNNPSGNLLSQEAIQTVLDAAENCLVVVDEAYIDFAETGTSWVSRLDQYPNLVVLQTFSKAWGLAALRLGMCFASEEIIRVLNKIKPPYNIAAPTQQLALDALQLEAAKDRMVAKILHERSDLHEKLLTLPIVRRIYPSDANFLLVRFDEAKAVFDFLIDRQVIVRDRSRVILCDDCLRITVGTAEENKRLIDTLKQYRVTMATTF